MIRFILRRDQADFNHDMRTTDYFTIDGDVAALEAALRRGGSGEMGFDQTTFVGIEVIDTTGPNQ